MPCCSGVPLAKVKNCLTFATAATRSAGPLTHPIFHPVVLNVLPPELIVSVRSGMPGVLAKGMCSCGANARCSYTSSLMTTASWRAASSAIVAHSAAVKTLPVGLCGVLSRTSAVRSLNAAARASSSSAKSGKRSGTVRRTPPARAMSAA